MKKHRLILIVLIIAILCVLLFTQCAMRKSEPLQQQSFVPANESIAHGEKVYMLHCQKCHPGGEAGLGPAINSNPAPQFIKRFQVRHGLGVMPAFKKGEISTTDLRNISKYLKAWKKY